MTLRELAEAEGETRERLLSQLVSKLEEQEILYHVLAGYEIRSLAADYSPPVHLQQLRKALVSKDEMKRVAQVLKHVPARQLSLKPVEEVSKKLHRYSREEIQGTGVEICRWISCVCGATCGMPST